ncbi:hypothetical protein [Paraburkholderia terricola]|uniref:hypothetical protein n=1 Tax=Paraburkholderia terricola TaxID=169427 RepID=UPI001FD63033|nr:hypothetical protein [Paraburkholderia terricola]
MDMPKDSLRTRELHRFWGFRKKRIKRFLECLACCLLLSSASLANANGDERAVCPAVSPSMGVFSAEKIYKNSVVSIEKNDADHTINLSIYRPNSNDCEKTVFAKYSIEGGAPNVDSLFFMNLDGKPNIFTIVHWDVNSRGIGTYGKYYQIFAYTSDEQGRLIENKRVVDNSAMTGMDGYQEGEQTLFPYKTAGAVKSFFKCNKAKCK